MDRINQANLTLGHEVYQPLYMRYCRVLVQYCIIRPMSKIISLLINAYSIGQTLHSPFIHG